MKIRELMTSPAYTVTPLDSLEKAAGLMWQHDIGILPVVDRDGRVGAAVTDRDVCMGAMMQSRPLAELRVADSMSHAVVTCRADEDVTIVAQRMCEHQLHRLPVVDEHGKACGMLSLNDLATAGAKDGKLAALAQKVLVATCRHRTSVPAVVGGETAAPKRNPGAAGKA